MRDGNVGAFGAQIRAAKAEGELARIRDDLRDFADPGKCVKRPAPKALDADGVEIRVGDKLYDTETGCARIVRAVNANGTIEFDGHDDRGWFANRLTHRAPVRAADGRPLREGETAWDIEDGSGYPHVVVSTELDGRYAPGCSACGWQSGVWEQYSYCPNCGARVEP